MSQSKTEGGRFAANTARNTAILAGWTAAWVLTMAIAVFGPKFLWAANDTLTLAAILLNLAIGFGMILANKRHLKGLDELQQKIHLEAMGVTLGVGLVAGLAYSNLDVANMIPGDAEISHLVILMGLVYLSGIIIGTRKYR